jgi:hypothetical protein
MMGGFNARAQRFQFTGIQKLIGGTCIESDHVYFKFR